MTLENQNVELDKTYWMFQNIGIFKYVNIGTSQTCVKWNAN